MTLNLRPGECPTRFDNLYIDLNSIVHIALHGNSIEQLERMSKAENFNEVWIKIMQNIDAIVHLFKPSGTLFIALDGVCPRAKIHD